MSQIGRQTSQTRVELRCKVCPAKHFVSSGSFVTHLSTVHCAVEGGSYTCKYGENGICAACPAVGISQSDYQSHVSWYHLQPSPPLATSSSRMSFSTDNDSWSVLSSTVNLPAVLNDPGKGKQRDFFTRSWGVDFVDSSFVCSSPHVCELPPNAFDRYLRKLRKYYSRHKKTAARAGQASAARAGQAQHGQTTNGSPSSVSSRETTPSPVPVSPPASPIKPQPKLDIPRIFLEQSFDLSNPDTFNRVFPFMQESLSQSDRSNPFQIEEKQIKAVETSGKLVQEQLSHYLDQVEVSIAGQVASKSHHFFQVMTYHDALMSQLVALISLVKSLRLRLADVEGGVVSALRVPYLLRRRDNLARIIEMLKAISDVHQTQPTIQSLLSVQEFAGALDLISTSQDILDDHVGDVVALRYLPNQLAELHDVIGRMLISDFQDIVSTELSRPVARARATCQTGAAHHTDEEGEEICQLDECALSSVVTGLIRQQSFTFLELLEEEGVAAVKRVIKEVVLSILDLTEEKTLTSLVAEFASRATPEGWSDLLDYLIGSLLLVLARVSVIHQVILSCIRQSEEPLEQLEDIEKNCDMDKITNGLGKINVKDNPFLNGDLDDLDVSRDSEDGKKCVSGIRLEAVKVGRLASSSREVMINICDQVHERLGKLVTVRSRPAAVKLVTPTELATVQELISTLAQTTSGICGKQCQGLQLSHQGQTILYIQWFHDAAMSRIATMLETEKWKKSSSVEPLVNLHTAVSSGSTAEGGDAICDNLSIVDSVPVFLTLLSDYCHLADQLPLATQEIGLKTADLLKLFNSRTCQLVLGAGAVSTAGLKTITIRNLAVTLRSLDLVAKTIQCVRAHFLAVSPSLTDKQMNALTRNFDHASRDFQDHLSELERKIVEVVDAALQQQLSSWERKPPVPSASFKSIGKQLTKLLESIQDVMPTKQVAQLFRTIHLQFLSRVSDRLKSAGLKADNSPTHGLVVSELIFYRENLKYMNVLDPKDLEDSALQRVWQR